MEYWLTGTKSRSPAGLATPVPGLGSWTRSVGEKISGPSLKAKSGVAIALLETLKEGCWRGTWAARPRSAAGRGGGTRIVGNVDRYRCRPLLIVDERRRARVEGSEGTQAVMRRDFETECIIIFPRRTHMARLQPTRTSYRIIFAFTGSATRGTHIETRRKCDPHKAHAVELGPSVYLEIYARRE